MKIRKIRYLLLFVLLLHSSAFAQSFKHAAGFWSAFNIHGTSSRNERIKYEFQFDLRFLFEDPTFNQAISRFVLGYVLTPSVSVWSGYEFTPTYDFFEDQLEYEQRLFEQVFIHVYKAPNFAFNSRSRLEFRDSFDEAGVAWRVRQMFIAEFLHQMPYKITPFLADEMFFNLNHPLWVSNDTLAQNRFYAGIIIPWKKYAHIELSYLNQIIVGRSVKRMNHIAYIRFILDHDLM